MAMQKIIKGVKGVRSTTASSNFISYKPTMKDMNQNQQMKSQRLSIEDFYNSMVKGELGYSFMPSTVGATCSHLKALSKTFNFTIEEFLQLDPHELDEFAVLAANDNKRSKVIRKSTMLTYLAALRNLRDYVAKRLGYVRHSRKRNQQQRPQTLRLAEWKQKLVVGTHQPHYQIKKNEYVLATNSHSILEFINVRSKEAAMSTVLGDSRNIQRVIKHTGLTEEQFSVQGPKTVTSSLLSSLSRQKTWSATVVKRSLPSVISYINYVRVKDGQEPLKEHERAQLRYQYGFSNK